MTNSILPGSLVSAEWLAAHLDDPRLRIVDIRGYVKTQDLGGGRQQAEYVGAYDEYLVGHIPGSVFIDWTVDIVDPDHEVRAQIAPPERFAAAMSERGIGDDTDVVAVDHSGGHFATRLWWALKYYGHNRVAVLDGGFNQWQELNFSLTDAIPEVENREFTPQACTSLRIEANELLGKIHSAESLIVDARDPDQYSGAIRRGTRGGHLPSAINLWAKSLVNEDGTWKKDDELLEILYTQGIQPGTPVIAYCNGGVTATAVLFALDRIGHTTWANYDGSWNEWGERLELPVVDGSEPG